MIWSERSSVLVTYLGFFLCFAPTTASAQWPTGCFVHDAGEEVRIGNVEEWGRQVPKDGVLRIPLCKPKYAGTKSLEKITRVHVWNGAWLDGSLRVLRAAGVASEPDYLNEFEPRVLLEWRGEVPFEEGAELTVHLEIHDQGYETHTGARLGVVDVDERYTVSVGTQSAAEMLATPQVTLSAEEAIGQGGRVYCCDIDAANCGGTSPCRQCWSQSIGRSSELSIETESTNLYTALRIEPVDKGSFEAMTIDPLVSSKGVIGGILSSGDEFCVRATPHTVTDGTQGESTEFCTDVEPALQPNAPLQISSIAVCGGDIHTVKDGIFSETSVSFPRRYRVVAVIGNDVSELEQQVEPPHHCPEDACYCSALRPTHLGVLGLLAMALALLFRRRRS